MAEYKVLKLLRRPSHQRRQVVLSHHHVLSAHQPNVNRQPKQPFQTVSGGAPHRIPSRPIRVSVVMRQMIAIPITAAVVVNTLLIIIITHQLAVLLSAFVQLYRSWISSQLPKHITWNTSWTIEY